MDFFQTHKASNLAEQNRMNVPSSSICTLQLLYRTTQEGPEGVLEELRNIRESLAKMQANKEAHAALAPAPFAANGPGVRLAVDPSLALAAANARKAVVHNVHFNATPDILKAHFSG